MFHDGACAVQVLTLYREKHDCSEEWLMMMYSCIVQSFHTIVACLVHESLKLSSFTDFSHSSAIVQKNPQASFKWDFLSCNTFFIPVFCLVCIHSIPYHWVHNIFCRQLYTFTAESLSAPYVTDVTDFINIPCDRPSHQYTDLNFGHLNASPPP